MSNDLIDLYRRADRNPRTLERVLSQLKDDDETIQKPDTSDIFNKKIPLENAAINDGQVYLNDTWVHPLFLKINNMLADGQSPIIIIVGKEGAGKSMAALVLSWTIHQRLNLCPGAFNPQQQTVYKVIPFLLLYRSVARHAIMFDEANETLNSNDYNSEFNMAVARTLRTQRKRQNINIFVGPEYKQLDTRIREKVDILIDMKYKQYGNVTLYKKKHGKRGNKGLDYDYERNGIPPWQVPDVPTDLKNKYEALDDQFKTEYLDREIARRINDMVQELQEEQEAVF